MRTKTGAALKRFKRRLASLSVRKPPGIEVERYDSVKSGAWFGATAKLDEGTWMTSRYHRTRVAAVRELKAKLRRMHGRLDELLGANR